MLDFKQEKKKMFFLFKKILPVYFDFEVDFDYSFTKDRFNLRFASKGEVVFHLAIVKRGFSKGSFGAYSSFLLKGGEIYNIMQRLQLENDESMPDKILIDGSYLNFIYKYPEMEYSGFEHYPFIEGINPESTVKRICADIQKFYFPLIRSVIFNPNRTLSLFLDDNLISYAGVRNPFTTCLILMGQSNNFHQLDKLIELAKDEDNGYYDYINSNNPKETIVKPIVDFFKNK